MKRKAKFLVHTGWNPGDGYRGGVCRCRWPCLPFYICRGASHTGRSGTFISCYLVLGFTDCDICYCAWSQVAGVFNNCPNVNPDLGRRKGPYVPDVIDHHLAASLATTTPLGLRGLVTVWTLQFEVQAGQHRFTALRQLVDKDQASVDGSSVLSLSQDLWWPAFIFDSDKLKHSDLERLRINGINNAFEDTDGIVWLRVLNIEEQEGSISAMLRRHIFAQTNREHARNNHGEKSIIYSGLFDVRSRRSKEVIRIDSTFCHLIGLTSVWCIERHSERARRKA